MNQLGNLLNSVTVGQPQVHANMKVYPLHVPNGHQRKYRTLDEAMQAKEIEVKEVDQSGSVPNLTVVNTGKLPVLLVTGQELVGAKQNRVLNTTVLVPAEQELEIPVSCVESGRWGYNSATFASSDYTAHSTLRRVQTLNVTDSLSKTARFDAKQNEVWHEVSRKMSAHGSSSPTSAMHDIYTQNDDKLKEYLDTFKSIDGQGIVVEIDGEIVAADLFDHAETLQQLWPKLARGYALDAIERERRAAFKKANLDAQSEATAQPAPKPEKLADTKEFITQAINAKDDEYKSVGLGKDVRLTGELVSGSGLLWEDAVIHTSLFAVDKQK